MVWGRNTTTVILTSPVVHKCDEKLTCPLIVSLPCRASSSGMYSGVSLWKIICGHPIGKVKMLSLCVLLNIQ